MNYEKVGNGWKCKECKTIIKREENLQKHLTSKSHLNYREKSDRWREQTGNTKVFRSLLNPELIFIRK